MSERLEAILRIPIGIIAGLILGLWRGLVQILMVVNWIITIITGRRNKGIAEFCEIWNTQVYIFLRYINLVSNKRPFPFTQLEKNLSKFE